MEVLLSCNIISTSLMVIFLCLLFEQVMFGISVENATEKGSQEVKDDQYMLNPLHRALPRLFYWPSEEERGS
ncbi:hypothetical protein HPP92_023441 [Vanilla planifolia]|uniref:Uncharacterized protein n=1 Tax=Vanilla planifolia TaxID=51239 RepID=A0A835PRH4_VANPL|nr:hypothetical protein HPP92_023441 [Vanilla planifolia]